MTQAVILAGGKGTRLASRLRGRPKPLIQVDGIPLLRRQLEILGREGVDEAVVLVNHAADQIASYISELDIPISVRLIDDGEPRGTAGAVLATLEALRDEFIVVYGDTLFDLDIRHLIDRHRATRADATLLVHPNDHPKDSDLVEVDDDQWITAFHSYPHPPDAGLANLVNAALYCVNKSALTGWVDRAESPCDFAKDLFPAMLAAGARLQALHTYEYIKDIGTPDRLDRAELHLRTGVVARAARRAPQKAVFIDRDGTLNVLRDYVRRVDDLELIPGAGAAIRSLNVAGYRVVVVTNQPVLARGETSVDELRGIHAKLSAGIGEDGGIIDAIYYCPHHPHAGFAGEVASLKTICDCRKPATGMFLLAADELNIDLAASWMIGDTAADIAAGRAIGARTILVLTGEGRGYGEHLPPADYIADDVTAAASIIVAADHADLVDRPAEKLA